MTKNDLHQYLADSKHSLLIDKLGQIRPFVDQELQNEIFLQSARYRTYKRQKRSGLLSREEQTIEIARINEALIEIINDLPSDNYSLRKKRKLIPWILSGSALAAIVLIFFIFPQFTKSDTNGLSNEKDETLNKNIKEKAPPKEETTNLENDTDNIKPENENLEKSSPPPSKKIEKKNTAAQQPSKTGSNGNTVWNNPVINGPVIDRPSGKIDITINNTEKKDTTNEN